MAYDCNPVAKYSKPRGEARAIVSERETDPDLAFCDECGDEFDPFIIKVRPDRKSICKNCCKSVSDQNAVKRYERGYAKRKHRMATDPAYRALKQQYDRRRYLSQKQKQP